MKASLLKLSVILAALNMNAMAELPAISKSASSSKSLLNASRGSSNNAAEEEANKADVREGVEGQNLGQGSSLGGKANAIKCLPSSGRVCPGQMSWGYDDQSCKLHCSVNVDGKAQRVVSSAFSETPCYKAGLVEVPPSLKPNCVPHFEVEESSGPKVATTNMEEYKAKFATTEMAEVETHAFNNNQQAQANPCPAGYSLASIGLLKGRCVKEEMAPNVSGAAVNNNSNFNANAGIDKNNLQIQQNVGGIGSNPASGGALTQPNMPAPKGF